MMVEKADLAEVEEKEIVEETLGEEEDLGVGTREVEEEEVEEEEDGDSEEEENRLGFSGTRQTPSQILVKQGNTLLCELLQ